jgi:hypothetical protein
MPEIEPRGVTPEEVIQDLEQVIRQNRENKYASQVGLKDLDFDVNEDQLKTLGLTLPFQTISSAEQALYSRAIIPITFLEHDETQHQVLVFDYRPVGYSGFMDCVTHSLALTDQGLFETGRYPAMSLSEQNRYWSWFLHRRLATKDEVTDWCKNKNCTPEEYVESVYQAMVHGL